jgi:hypothetical protein
MALTAGEYSVKAKQITKAGLVFVATAVYAGAGFTPTPPTTPPPVTAPGPQVGWPDASNTGVPAGVSLRPSGGMTITQSGTVISGLDVDGCIIVRASNVVIQNTRVRQNGDCWGGAIDTEYGAWSNIVIQNVEVDGRRMNPGAPLVGSGGYTCIRCNLHDGGQGFHLTNNVTVLDSYVHDLYGSGSTHNDAVLSNGGSHFLVRHNTLLCDVGFPGNASTGGGCTGAFNLFGDFGQVDDVLADNNLFYGGAYCVFAGSGYNKPYPNSTNIRFTNNKFGRTSPSWSNCGIYGPYTGWANNAGNMWLNNSWLDTSAAIP